MSADLEKSDFTDSTAQQYSLLTTKLYVPPPRPNLVSRPRLMARLKAGLSNKLVLVSAPAGSGKTTMLSDWFHQSDLPRAWLSLDPGDDDPVRFLTYVIAALQTIESGIGKSALSVLQSPKPPLPETVVTTLINDLTTISRDFVLILDDYYLLDSPQIHHMVEFLLDHLPARMHLVITTRADPPLPLARMRAHDQLIEIRAADLSFTAEETLSFIQKATDLQLAPDDIRKLLTRTEGWIAGLQLAVLSMQGRPDISAFINSFTGDERHIADYLIEEVLHQQPESVETFLLHTSILERLSASLCDAVTGQDNSQRILTDLERANLFIIPLDDDRHWYRYHHLFTDLLRQHLKQTQSDLLPTLHRRASAWYKQHDLMPEAIDHALSAKEYELAADLIEQAMEAMFMRSEIATFHHWVETLPEDIVSSRPALGVYHAVGMLLRSHPLDEVQAQVLAAGEADTTGSVSGELIAFRALTAAYRGDTKKSAELCHQALETLPEERTFIRSFVAGTLGLAYLYSGDLKAATENLNEAARICKQVGNLVNAVLALCHLAEVAMLRGQLNKAEALYRQALELAVDDRGRTMPIAGMALIGLGGLLRERNDPEAAISHLEEGIELTQKWSEAGAIGGYLRLAFIKQVRGDTKGADEEIQEAKRIAIQFDAMEVDDIMVAMAQARLWAWRGDEEAATNWITSRGLDEILASERLDIENEGMPSHIIRTLELVSLAQVCIALDRSTEALTLLEPLLTKAETAGWSGVIIEILALRALGLQAQGDNTRAGDSLLRALSLAEPEGYIRTFVDQGEPMAALLKKVQKARHWEQAEAELHISPGYIKKLLLAFKVAALPSTSEVPTEALSDRELEVLKLIETGLSNSDIATILFISLDTVKSHTRNINSKLHVHSRTQAVAKARELGIL
ncbi:MAG: tetratricopeptide repeat protein [Fidelibacterota bacterium]|nr:MAG: tetratricopeptide repeat protein [Candidatus Neomarinimicrobiota bacterium]